MSKISLSLVVKFKVKQNSNKHGKDNKKNVKITAFGRKNFVLDKFDTLLEDVIDHILGLRSNATGYQYNEILVLSSPCSSATAMSNV